MQINTTELPGLLVLTPVAHQDERGFFVRTLDVHLLAQAGVRTSFVQHNQSRSGRGTLRGLHLRAGPGESKLVRCARGSVHDVVVDLRPWSPTFRRVLTFVLDDVDHRQLLIPPGVAHGFQVLSEVADLCYAHDEYYEQGADVAVAWDDVDLAVPWPAPPLRLSDRDASAPPLAHRLAELEAWFPEPSRRGRPGVPGAIT